VLDVDGGEEVEPFQFGGQDGAFFVDPAFDKNDEEGGEEVEYQGGPDERAAKGVGELDAGNPEGARDKDADEVEEHVAAHHGDEVADPDIVDCVEKALCKEEGYQLYPGGFERLGNIEGVAEEADHDEEDADALADVVHFEPADDEGEVAPHFPAEGEGDDEFDQGIARWALGCAVANDANDSNVEQVYKELEGGNFLHLGGSPEETLMEVLTDDWLPPEFKRLAITAFGIPVSLLMVTRYRAGRGTGLSSSYVGVVAKLREVRIQGDPMVGQHV